MSQKQVDWKDIAWALGVATQVGGSISGPVLIGLVVGWWLDGQFGSMPWITVSLALIGGVTGPIIGYRFLMRTIKGRFSNDKEGNS